MEVAALGNVIVIKVGTTTMFRHQAGREVLDEAAFSRIGQQILRLKAQGCHVAIVSSGAVTAGMEATGTTVRPTGRESMPETQRLSTIGWHRVLNRWQQALPGTSVGGLLITRRELNLDTPEHDEALRTTHTLLSHGDVPVLNENDAITHAELSHQSFGQNDELAAIYAAQIAGSALFGGQVRLVLLSDVDGVYADLSDRSSIIRTVTDPAALESVAGGSSGPHGTGGMRTKLAAARIAAAAGVDMWIANGQTDGAIELALEGRIGTHFQLSRQTAPNIVK